MAAARKTERTGTAEAMRPHDHGDCIRRVLDEAERRASEDKVNFTPVRRHALEILLESHAAMPAYGLLKRLEEDGFGSQPPVAYRALDFLIEQGFVHKVERLNAFVACMYPHEAHTPAFLICRNCRSVAETCVSPTPAALRQEARAAGFTIERSMMEAEGLCRACAAEGGPPCN